MSWKLALQIGTMLGWQDLRQAYRRSKLGQFWLTAGMALQITTIAVVFGLIFHADIKEYLPFVSTGVILWGLISSNLIDGCMAFIQSEPIIKQLKLPLVTHVIRVIWKNILTFTHNIVLLPIVFLLTGKQLSLVLLLAPLGFVIVIWNLTWIAYLLATISARFRDMPPIVNSLSLILFYVTPVMWYPSSLSATTAHYLLGLNPFYHLYQLLRQPVIGEVPTIENYAISLGFAAAGSLIALLVARATKSKIAYWV